MFRYISTDENGLILYSAIFASPDDAQAAIADGQNLVAVRNDIPSAELMAHYYDAATTSLVPLPPKPEGFYRFDGATKQWQFDAETADREARQQRQTLLFNSDYTQLPDAPVSNKADWAAYRQALRDITGQADYPRSIVWPVAPAA